MLIPESIDQRIKRQAHQDSLAGKISSSKQMLTLRDMDQVGILDLARHNNSKLSRTHNSTKHNLKDKSNPTFTPWADDVSWAEMYIEIRDWINTYIQPALAEEWTEYMDKVIKYHLSYYSVDLHIEKLLEYGINNTEMNKEIKDEMETLMTDLWKSIKITNDYLPDVDKLREFQKNWKPEWDKFYEIRAKGRNATKEEQRFLATIQKEATEEYTEFILSNPEMTVINNQATSSWPDYERQSHLYVLGHCYEAEVEESEGYITFYFRLHGAKDTKEKMRAIKVRVVGGPEYKNKQKGTPFTFDFRRAAPNFTAYYKDWDTIFLKYLIPIYKKYGTSLLILTTDQNGFDTNFDSERSQMTTDTMVGAEEAVKRMKDNDRIDTNNPKIVMNGLYYVVLNRHINVSGSVLNPAKQSVFNHALHELYFQPEFNLVQIDDIILGAEPNTDIKAISKRIRADTGFDIDSDKTESNLTRDYVVFLQVVIGKIWKDSDEVFCIGSVPRRVHRLRYRERNRVSSTGEIIVKAEGKHMTDNAQRMLGTISSLGPLTLSNEGGYALMKIFRKYLGHTKEWKEIYEISRKRHLYTDVGDWGFNPRWCLEWFSEHGSTF